MTTNPKAPNVASTISVAERVRSTVIFWLCAIVLVASLVLGGGTRAGFLSDVLLQWSAIPLVIALLWRSGSSQRSGRFAVILCSLVVLVPALQLVPLPPALWSHLPMRDVVVAAFDLTRLSLPWMPLSVSPSATWVSALSLIPPVALFVGVRRLDVQARRRLSLVLIGIGLMSVLLGLLQIAQGPTSPLRLFEFTNPSEAVGFFANRNHFAALLFSALLFAAAWVLNLSSNTPSNTAGLDAKAIGLRLLGATVLIAFIAGELMARSRAGLGLTMLALLGVAFLPVLRAQHGPSATRIIVGVALVTLLLATQFVLYRIFERFGLDPLDDARVDLATTTIQAAKAFMPWGSGMGTFVPVYQLFERREELAPSYANHAHNDVLELWLEAGVVSFLLMGLFALWFFARSFDVWRRQHSAHALDLSLARAASLVIVLLIAHSLVDYPLRTGAMMAVFAFSCALLVRAPERGDEHETSSRSRHAAGRRPPPIPTGREARVSVDAAHANLGPETETRQQVPAKAHERWGEDVAWPEAWRNPPKDR
ncbi:MAG: O-antigen ligase family protein [Hyphomicrobiaceae bacterium]